MKCLHNRSQYTVLIQDEQYIEKLTEPIDNVC
jgi:hypothetical protein